MPLGKSLVLLLMLAVSAACSSGRAQVIEDRPTLVVPPVPPRTIEPPALVLPPPVDPPADPAPATSTPASKPKSTPKNEAKPEPKPETPPETTIATVPNPPPVAPLRTPTTPSGPEATRQIKDILARAENVLSRVDYQKLTADRRATYESAKSFIAQADEAIKKEDLTLARSFAERAENIAKQLEAR
jgi:outer membrane biosynthesis protein TonB